MFYTVKYAFFFIVVVLLQVLLFNNIALSVYISPLVYIAFILLLPIDIHPFLLLVLGLVLGIVMDMSMALVGVNTMASLFTAFSRPYLLELIIGKELIKDGGEICRDRIGTGKLIRYILFATVIHCTLFFSLETMQWDYYLYTLIRITISSLITAMFVFLLSLVINGKPSLRV